MNFLIKDILKVFFNFSCAFDIVKVHKRLYFMVGTYQRNA